MTLLSWLIINWLVCKYMIIDSDKIGVTIFRVLMVEFALLFIIFILLKIL
jgi:hypothetical protein